MAMVTSLAAAAAAAIDLPLSLLPPPLPDILDSAGLDRKPMDRPTDHGRADAGGDPKNDLDVLREGRGRPDYGCVTCAAVLPSEF